MSTERKKLLKIPGQDKIRSFLMSYYMIGFAGFVINHTYDIFRQLISASILLSVILMMLYHRNWSSRFLAVSLIIFVFGWGIELIGTKTGFPFGSYSYTRLLVPLLGGVPLILGLNWFFLVYCTFIISSFIPSTNTVRSLAGALMMTAYDLLLEPFATHTGMWEWEAGTIPLSNYISWFVISFIFLRLMYINKPEKQNKTGIFVFVFQAGFFAALVLTWKIMSL